MNNPMGITVSERGASCVKLNDREQKVLTFLADEFSEEFGCFGFAPIMSETGLDRRNVRLACRSLKRKGLTEFHRAMWSMDGEPAGAGYGATKGGVERAENLPRLCEDCGKNPADLPSRICVGCDAYRGHQR